MELNIYEPPRSSGHEIPPRGSLVRKYLTFSGALTIAAAVLCEVSLSRVRLLLPEYPDLITLGLYQPLEVVRFFHSVGATGLVVLFLAAGLVTLVIRKIPLPAALLRAGAVVHLAFLSLATLAYGFCLWQISRVLS